jgi:hypothetical protein
MSHKRRSLHFRSLQQVCRAAAQAQADRPIQSDQVCATNQRAAGAGNLDRHASAVHLSIDSGAVGDQASMIAKGPETRADTFTGGFVIPVDTAKEISAL